MAGKLGIFDSGLGGLLILKAIRELIPDIDIVYLGDTLHLPYGNRSEAAIYRYTENCVDYLFRSGCELIVVACNTASASALRKLQQGYLLSRYPDRRILGVVVPTIETAIEHGRHHLGLLGTNYTVRSHVYEEELKKINPDISLTSVNAPLLVPMIEYSGFQWIEPVLDSYMRPLLSAKVDAVLLSCTHYVCLKDKIRSTYNVDVLSQDEIIPKKLFDYLKRHPEISNRIGRASVCEYQVTDYTQDYENAAVAFMDQSLELKCVEVHP